MSANVKRMRGLAIHRAILIGNTATPLSEAERIVSPPDHTHRWTVAVRSAASNLLPVISEADQIGVPSSSRVDGSTASGSGLNSSTSNGNLGEANQSNSGATASSSAGVSTRGRESETDYHKMVGGRDDISHFIKRVQFKLHETYPQHTRNIDKPPFQVTETGWGEFDIQIKIFFVPESGEKPISTFHRLKLHPWHPIAVHAPDAGLGNPEGSMDVALVAGDSITNTSDAGIGSADQTMNVDGENEKQDEEEEGGKDLTDGEKADVSMANTSTRDDMVPSAVTSIKNEEVSTPMVHETRSASAAALPALPSRPMPAVVHSWSYDEVVFPEPTESFYEILIKHPPTPLPSQSAQAFIDPSAFERYKNALKQLNESSGPQGRDLNSASGILPPHPLHDTSGAMFDALSQEAILAEGERLDKARHDAVHELEETRAKLIEGEQRIRMGRQRTTAV